VDSSVGESFLETILESLSTNKTVEYLKITDSSFLELNLKDSNSLRFIEKNSNVKILDFSNVEFTDTEMKIFNYSLMKNNSIIELNLSGSVFKGPFEFLTKKNLKKFSFFESWNHLNFDSVNDFIKHLKFNQSNSLGFSMSRDDSDVEELGEILEVLMKLEKLESLEMDCLFEDYSSHFYKLLKNTSLKYLKLRENISEDVFENLLKALNDNETLTHLDISLVENEDYPKDFSDLQINNKTLKTLKMNSNQVN
jgi:hypothetical protein